MPHQDDARQLREGLDDVEVAQGAHLEEGHAVLLGVGPRLLGGHLPFEGEVQTVADQDSRHSRGMLGIKQRPDRFTFSHRQVFISPPGQTSTFKSEEPFQLKQRDRYLFSGVLNISMTRADREHQAERDAERETPHLYKVTAEDSLFIHPD